ncbi:DUF6585 family protein [Planctomyces sp. SH-PL14]|uniref:DUF6585 family protein n=1 Tax=Planctomyces sp. SH-PL14 TaxID=1632864 RepID=UPI00078C7CF2|nr:DUF6585 family protein [Planctomyces sp. SH-PL14]AMV19222.1 hypothetical protein VT03_15130 [Planctomyces sp. SH-PL14]
MVNGQQVDEERAEEIEDLGEPTSVHMPSQWRRTLDQFSDPERVVPWVLTGLFILVAGVLFQQYWSGAWGAGGPAVAMPIGGAVCLALAIGSAAFGWRTLRKPPKVIDRPTYFLYPEAIVVETSETTEILRWADVDALLAPPATGKGFRLDAQDGRKFELTQSVEEWGTLIQTIIARVTAEKLPAALEALAAGETLRFRNLGIRREGLSNKDKQINWSEVTAMVLLVKPGASLLTVRKSGSLLNWCSMDLLEMPNNQLVYELLVRTAPKHLLKEEKA